MFRNTTIVVGARVCSKVAGLVTALATAATLHPRLYGDLSAAIATGTIVGAVCLDLGFNVLFQRESARSPSETGKQLRILLTGRLVSSFVAFPVLAVSLALLGLSNLILPACTLMLLASLTNLMRLALYANQRVSLDAAAILIETALLVGLVLIGASKHLGVDYFMWAYTAPYVFDLFYFYLVLRWFQIADLKWEANWAVFRRWMRMGLPFAMTFGLSMLYWKIDVPLLQYFRGGTEVGWYTLAYKPLDAMIIIPVSAFNVALPVLLARRQQSLAELRHSAENLLRALFMIGWPLSLGTLMLSSAIPNLWSGFYRESVPALEILSLGIVLTFVNMALIATVTALERQTIYAFIALLSLVFNVSTNVILIPRFGYLATSYVTIATEVVLGGCCLVVIGRDLGRFRIWRSIWRPMVAGLVMAVALVPFHDVRGPAVLAAIAFGAVSYTFIALALHALSVEELRQLRLALSARS